MPNDGPAHNIVPDQPERKLLVVLCLTSAIMLVEVIGGYLSGSLALLADAGHMFTDVVALLLSYFALRLGRRAPDDHRTYGYQRLKILAAYTNGILLFALTGLIIFEAIDRLSKNEVIDGDMMLTIALIGLVTNLISYVILGGPHHHGAQHGHPHHHDHGHAYSHDHHAHDHDKDLNIQSASLHVLSDLLGSVGAVAAALVIKYTGWMPIDPILSVFICLLIFGYAWGLVKKTTHILIEGTPDSALPEKIKASLTRDIKGVLDVHHLHVWSLTENQHLATLHVTIEQNADNHGILCAIEQHLEKNYGLDHVTVQIEKGPCFAL